MSQSDLAEKAYVRRPSVSKIETGMRSVTADEVIYLGYALDKPILYFFPAQFTQELIELSPAPPRGAGETPQ
jgi:transcriptional regulator with XRE-family HTH domain